MEELLVCAACKTRLKVKPGSTKSRYKCPKCGAGVERPSVEADHENQPDNEDFEPDLPPLPVRVKSRSDKSPADLMRRLLAGFEGSVARRGPSLGYRVALLFTALAVVFLGLCYACLIVAGGFGVYWYAVTILPTALHFRGRVGGFLLIVHLAVLLSAGCVLISMVLPIFLRRKHELPGERLSPGKAPVLHSFVAKIADTLGAPVPVEIRLGLDANASAAYRGGVTGLLRGQLVLTLGAPLIAGMDTQQLAGVIAHELGHFCQRGGSLLRYFIGSFTTWCAISSSLQDSMADLAGDGDADESAISIIFRGIFWLTQCLGSLAVWCFALLGLLVTMFVMRSQEYDADRRESELAGSDAFFGTTRRLIELNMGQQVIFRRGLSNLYAVLNDADGVGNLASEIVAAADLAAEQSTKVIEKELQRPTGWFSTHPGTRARIAAVRQRPQPGVFHLKIPAYRLYPELNPHAAS